MTILRRLPAFLPLLLAFFLCLNNTVSAQNWEKMSFQGTSAYCFAEKDGVLFAGTNEGVYQLESDGNTWKRIALPTRTIFTLIAKGDKMFCGTAGEGVLRSDDNGQNWTDANGNIPKGISVQSLMVRDGAYLFAGTNVTGIYVSTDNGANWQAKGLSNEWIYSMVMNGETIFAGTFGNGIFRSADNGATWLKSDTGVTNPFVKALYSPSTSLVYAGTLGGGAFRSLSSGSSWTDISAGIAGREIRAITMGGKYNYLYVGTGKDGVFASADSGRSWQQFRQNLGNPSVNSLIITKDYLIAGTDDGIYRQPYTPVGVEEEEYEAQNSAKIFPQPAGITGTSLRFPAQWHGRTIRLTLVNVMGELMQSVECSDDVAHIPTSNLASGVYLLRAECGRESVMQKLVKE